MRGIHWFRNDLRLTDNLPLVELADHVEEWLPVFVFDEAFLGGDLSIPRVQFLLDSLERLRADLAKRKIPMVILSGAPEVELPRLMHETKATWVSFGESSSPRARDRDRRVSSEVERAGGQVLCVRDSTVFHPGELRTKAGTPYTVFTPFRNAWWRAWEQAPRLGVQRLRLPKRPVPTQEIPSHFLNASPNAVAERTAKIAPNNREGDLADIPTGGERAALRRLRKFLAGPVSRYAVDRDLPGKDGTSRISPHLRFGTLSVRRCFAEGLAREADEPGASEGIRKWLDELIWREFYDGILVDFPHVVNRNFRSQYDALDWKRDDAHFDAWCSGLTGFPFIDAGMRQLRSTGWMHNRVRMVVASFLTKDLLIDWRRGADYFFERLVDGDPASNNGGWQWAASTGTDAQPYFRIFNPTTQGQKWDPDGAYVKQFVPELRHAPPRFIHTPWLAPEKIEGYPAPIVDHAVAREQALAAYRNARAIAGA